MSNQSLSISSPPNSALQQQLPLTFSIPYLAIYSLVTLSSVSPDPDLIDSMILTGRCLRLQTAASCPDRCSQNLQPTGLVVRPMQYLPPVSLRAQIVQRASGVRVYVESRLRLRLWDGLRGSWVGAFWLLVIYTLGYNYFTFNRTRHFIELLKLRNKDILQAASRSAEQDWAPALNFMITLFNLHSLKYLDVSGSQECIKRRLINIIHPKQSTARRKSPISFTNLSQVTSISQISAQQNLVGFEVADSPQFI